MMLNNGVTSNTKLVMRNELKMFLMQLIKYHLNWLYQNYNIVWLQYSQEGQELYAFNTWKSHRQWHVMESDTDLNS